MLQALLILLVYIVGPAAILIWAARRFRQGIKPGAVEIGVVVMAVVLIALFTYAYTWNTSDRDARDAQVIVEQLTQRFSFPKARFQDKPAVEATARARQIEIRIYGVLDDGAQKQVIAIARDLRRQVSSKALLVQFYAEEKWEIREDGTRLPRPDQEVPIRKQRIE
jgi:hypothetical protein